MDDARQEMVEKIEKSYKLDSPLVLAAMLHVPRHEFVDVKYRDIAYDDAPVSVGYGQTMSQPYTVAVMSKLITEFPIPKSKILNKTQVTNSKIQKIAKSGKVLEIGTGSGYQAAVLSKLFKEVYTLEIIPELAEKAKSILDRLGYKNVYVKKGSGEWGWEEEAPFDAIMITAGVEKMPEALFEQLKVDGVLIAPLGQGMDKVMTKYTKQSKSEFKKEEFGIFHFVPFVEEGN